MGVLDDAIRDHLELKRQHGASDAEVAQAEAEALGPARRGAETAAADDLFQVHPEQLHPPQAGDVPPEELPPPDEHDSPAALYDREDPPSGQQPAVDLGAFEEPALEHYPPLEGEAPEGAPPAAYGGEPAPPYGEPVESAPYEEPPPAPYGAEHDDYGAEHDDYGAHHDEPPYAAEHEGPPPPAYGESPPPSAADEHGYEQPPEAYEPPADQPPPPAAPADGFPPDAASGQPGGDGDQLGPAELPAYDETLAHPPAEEPPAYDEPLAEEPPAYDETAGQHAAGYDEEPPAQDEPAAPLDQPTEHFTPADVEPPWPEVDAPSAPPPLRERVRGWFSRRPRR